MSHLFSLALLYGNSAFVAVSNIPSDNRFGAYELKVFTSADGLQWKSQVVAQLSHGRIEHVRFVHNQFVMVGGGGAAFSSPDGVTWSQLSVIKHNYDLRDIAYGQGKYVIVGDTESYIFTVTSSDLIRWDVHDYDGPSETVTFASDQFVAGGNGVATSTDGIHWTKRDVKLCDGCGIRDVVFGSNRFVTSASYGGEADELLASTDGITWTVVDRNQHRENGGLAYGNGLFVAFSEGKVKTSGDGENWRTENTPDHTADFGAITFGDGKFVAVGGTARVALVGTTSENSSGDSCLSFSE